MRLEIGSYYKFWVADRSAFLFVLSETNLLIQHIYLIFKELFFFINM